MFFSVHILWILTIARMFNQYNIHYYLFDLTKQSRMNGFLKYAGECHKFGCVSLGPILVFIDAILCR